MSETFQQYNSYYILGAHSPSYTTPSVGRRSSCDVPKEKEKEKVFKIRKVED